MIRIFLVDGSDFMVAGGAPIKRLPEDKKGDVESVRADEVRIGDLILTVTLDWLRVANTRIED